MTTDIPQEDIQAAGQAASSMTSFSPGGPEPSCWWRQGNRLQFTISAEAQQVLRTYMPAIAASERIREDIRINLECLLMAFKGARLGRSAAIMAYFTERGPSLELHFHGSRCAVYPNGDHDFCAYAVKDVESPALLAVANLAIQGVVHPCLKGIVAGTLNLAEPADLSACVYLRVERDPTHEPMLCYGIVELASQKIVGVVRSLDSSRNAFCLLPEPYNDPDLYDLEELPDDGADQVILFAPSKR